MEVEGKLKEIQILLFSLPCTSNKEYGSLLKDYKTETSLEKIIDMFDRIFSISKYTNTEVYHFLSVFSKFLDYFNDKLRDKEDFCTKGVASKVIALKFFPAEKDTELAIYKYFEVVNKMEVEKDSLKDIYSRYIFLQSKEIVNSVMLHFIYSKFKEFLEKNPIFLKYTLDKGIYKEMILRNDFLMDYFPKLKGVNLVDSSFESNIGIRIFVINSTRNKYLMQEFFSDIPPWYLKSLSPRLIPFLYYNFDVYGIFRELGLEYVNTLNIEEFHQEVEKEKMQRSNEDVGKKDNSNDDNNDEDVENSLGKMNLEKINISSYENTSYDEIKLLRSNLKESISTFNKTLDMDLLFNTFGQVESMMLLRSSKSTNLRSLGDFLCKAKNEKVLRVFTGTFDFREMTVVEALRVYLGAFYLVGESQVIHRVLEAFSDKYFMDYCSSMAIKEEEKTRKFLFNFSFSLLVLNTKMYNPNIKVKPTFSVYMEDFTKEEIPEAFSLEYLQSQYESVCESKLELAVRNKAGKDNFMVYEAICKRYGIPTKMVESNICTLHPFKDIFSRIYSNFLDSPPETFFSLCISLGETKAVDRYLRESKGDTNRFLSMFSLYLRLEGDLEMYKTFLQVLKRVEKPRHSILPQYKATFSDILNSEVHDVNLLAEALKSTSNPFVTSLVVDILVKNYEGLRDLSMLQDSKIGLVLDKAIASGNRSKFKELSRFMSPGGLIAYYKEMLETVPRFLNEEICQAFKDLGVYNEDSFCIVLNLQKEFDMFDFVVEIKEEKIECRGVNSNLEETRYLIGSVGDRMDGEDVVVGCDVVGDGSKNDDNGKNDENDNVHITPSHHDTSQIQKDNFYDLLYCRVDEKKDILSCYSFVEKFPEILNNPTNLFHFYASSKSILNQSKAKTIHKSGCPLQQDLFSPRQMDPRLIYMLKKAGAINNKDVSNYTLWVVNLISSSLPLFCRFFLDNFGLLLAIKSVNPIIKIFCSRLSKTLSGNPLCCKCGFNKLTPVENLIKMIVKYDLASVEDFAFYFSVRMEKIKSGEIEIENGELILKE